MMQALTPAQMAALAAAQGNISMSLTPYADMAEAVGLTEAEVLELLRGLRHCGAIRRFGASLRHQQAGWTSNAMVAWRASPEQADRAGTVAAAHPRVSHVYYRPSQAPDWPYTFYTMVHGQNDGECAATIAALAENLGLEDYAVLHSIRELKKTSMQYF